MQTNFSGRDAHPSEMMTLVRRQVFTVLFPLYDRAVSAFRTHRTGKAFADIQRIALAMQCADSQSERVLKDILEHVAPSQYVHALCTRQDRSGQLHRVMEDVFAEVNR